MHNVWQGRGSNCSACWRMGWRLTLWAIYFHLTYRELTCQTIMNKVPAKILMYEPSVRWVLAALQFCGGVRTAVGVPPT